MTRVTIMAGGSIQGVGYRTLVKQATRQLGIKGLARNLPDGTVEIFCDGSSIQIKKLLKMIDYKGRKNDPLSAYVARLKVYKEGDKGYRGPWKEYGEFDIDYGFEIKSLVDREIIDSLESGKFYVASSRDVGISSKDELTLLRTETSENFHTMDKRYGSISEEMGKMRKEVSEEIKRLRVTFERLAKAYVER
jgi:acylphosphatase